MSYANTLAAALREVARADYKAVFEAGSIFARAHAAVAKSDNIMPAMQATIDLVVAVEHLHDMAEQATKSLRAALAEAMVNSGGTTITGQYQTAYLSKKPAFLNISDESKIPREYYVQGPPALDRAALKAAIKNGAEVPGASLIVPNEMSLVIRSKETKS